jgi:multimeric flavodoxin WrbA
VNAPVCDAPASVNDCSEGGADDDVFELLDRILASDGFVSVTP